MRKKLEKKIKDLIKDKKKQRNLKIFLALFMVFAISLITALTPIPAKTLSSGQGNKEEARQFISSKNLDTSADPAETNKKSANEYKTPSMDSQEDYKDYGYQIELNDGSQVKIVDQELQSQSIEVEIIDEKENQEILAFISDKLENQDKEQLYEEKIEKVYGYQISNADLYQGNDKVRLEIKYPKALESQGEFSDWKLVSLNSKESVEDLSEDESTKFIFDQDYKVKKIEFEVEESSKVLLLELKDQDNNPKENKLLADVKPMSNGGGTDFTNYITQIVVSKRQGNQWVPSTEFKEDDQVKVEIKYQLPDNVTTIDNPSIYYQLPEGIRPISEESGDVISGNKKVGTYVIGTDGKIDIIFDDDFIESGGGIDGSIRFDGTITNLSGENEGIIDFGGQAGSITIIKPEEEKFDISTRKIGTINKEKTKVDYTITVSTEKGTEDEVVIEDYLNSQELNAVYDKSSLKVYKISNGIKTEVDPADYTLTWDIKENSNNHNFKIEGLEKLGPEERYVVEYQVDLKANENKDYYSVNNNAYGKSSTKTSQYNSNINWKKSIKKEGEYDRENNLISWTIEINPHNYDISGWTFTDTVPYEIVGDVTISVFQSGSPGKKIEVKDGIIIDYTFDEFSNQSDKTKKHVIKFKTKVPENISSVYNEAFIETPYSKESDSAQVKITQNDWILTKNFNEPYEEYVGINFPGEISDQGEKRNIVVNTWRSSVKFPKNGFEKFVYTDTIENAFRKSSNGQEVDLGPDSHYAVANELDQDLKLNLFILGTQGDFYKYQGNGNKVLYSDNIYGINMVETDDITIKVDYFDKDGNKVSEKGTPVIDDGGNPVLDEDGKQIYNSNAHTPVKKFTITVTPTVTPNIDLKASSLEIYSYKTYTESSKIDYYDTIYSRNTAETKGVKDSKDVEFKKNPRLLKTVLTREGNVYESGNNEIDFDANKGRIKYKLVLNTTKYDNGDIILRDILPKGSHFVPGSLRGEFDRKKGGKDPKPNFEFKDGTNPTYNIEIEDGREVLEIKISNYKFHEFYRLINLYYEVDINEDVFWEDIKNTSKEYLNSVDWNGEKSATNTRVRRDVDKILKSGVQLDYDGNPISENSSVSGDILYTVIVNPAGIDLDISSDVITLTDKLKNGSEFNPSMDIESIKLYYYEPNSPDNKGALIDDNIYNMQYDSESSTIILKIPDELACVLEYKYHLDPSFAGGYQLNNYVNLIGEWSSEIKTALKDATSSATATKRSITIYKVDEDNFKKILPGTKFKLDYFDKDNSVWKEQESEIVVGDQGTIKWDLAGSNPDLINNRLYRLTETYAVEGYSIPEEPFYFIWMDDSNKADDSYQAIGQGHNVNKDSIRFFNGTGGIEYLTNKYTRVSVTKVWLDSSGGQIENPDKDEVYVQLFRNDVEIDGYEITLIQKSSADWVSSDKIVKLKVNKNTDKGVDITFDGWMGDPTYSYVVDGEVFEGKVPYIEDKLVLKIFKIVDDMVITVHHTNNHQGVTFTNYDRPDYALLNSIKIGNPVILNKDNGWIHHWDNLVQFDENGDPYYYTVEEINVEGYNTSYVNNEGIQTGDIKVINSYQGYALPETGGSGINKIYFAGISLLIISLIVAFIFDKKDILIKND